MKLIMAIVNAATRYLAIASIGTLVLLVVYGVYGGLKVRWAHK